MKTTWFAILAIAVLAIAGGVQAESGMFWEFTGGLWGIPDAEGYQVSAGGGGFLTEEYDVDVALAANAKFGYQFDQENAIADVAALAGWYVGPVMGFTVGGDASYRFKVGEKGSFTIGPHIGLNVYTAPTWLGDLDDYVEFDGTVGGLIGIKATFGSRRVRGVLTADIVGAEFDASAKNGGTISSDTLDMGGFLIQGGVQF